MTTDKPDAPERIWTDECGKIVSVKQRLTDSTEDVCNANEYVIRFKYDEMLEQACKDNKKVHDRLLVAEDKEAELRNIIQQHKERIRELEAAITRQTNERYK